MPDAYELLSADHRAVEALLLRSDESGDDAIAGELADLLTLHAEIEEQVLYPELRRLVDGGDDLANGAQEEHAVVKVLIGRMSDSSPDDLRPLLREIGED